LTPGSDQSGLKPLNPAESAGFNGFNPDWKNRDPACSGGSMGGEGGDGPPPSQTAAGPKKTATPAMFLLHTKRAIFVIFVSVKHSRCFNCLSSHILCRRMQLVCRCVCVSSDSRLYVATENDITYANAQLKRFNACC